METKPAQEVKRILAVLFSCLFLVGCFLPSKKVDTALQNVQKAEQAIAKVEDKQIGFAATSAHATARALDAAPESKAVDVAKQFNDRTVLALPKPPAAEALAVEKVVDALLAERKESAEMLRKYDQQLVGLQDKIAALQKQLEKAETKRDDTMLSISSLADLGARMTWWARVAVLTVFALVMGPFLLRILAAFVPAAGPIAGVASIVLGKVGGSLISAVPGAAQRAGFVAASAARRTEEALEDAVTAIQRARKQHGLADQLDPILEKVTGPRDSQRVIREVKDRLRL